MSDYWVPAPGSDNYGQPLFLASEYGPGVQLIDYSERGAPGYLVNEFGPGVQAVMFRESVPAHLQQPMAPPPGAIAAMLQQQSVHSSRSDIAAWLVLGL